MDAEERQMFRDMSKDVREGFTGVYKKVDDVQTSLTASLEEVKTSINMGKIDQSVLDERLKTHMADDNRHRNPEQEKRDQEQRARLERSEKTNKSAGSFPEWLSLRVIMSICAGIGTLIAAIIGALSL